MISYIGLFYFSIQACVCLPSEANRPKYIYTVHVSNNTDTFHEFNKTTRSFHYTEDDLGGQLRNHDTAEWLTEESEHRANSEINNALSQFPRVNVDESSSTSRRHKRKETCMTLMWKRHLSHQVTPEMKSSACKQYQKWGEGMKKRTPFNADQQTKFWLSNLGLDAFRERLGTRHRRQTLRQRKEYRMMTQEERERFHNAVRRLKQIRLGPNNRYDVFVLLHQPSSAPAAHFGPAFLGWHREMLFRFENALREIDSEVTIPYWDSTLDGHLSGQEDDAITWSDEFFGPRRGQVTTGPFANFPLVINVNGRNTLHRGIGNSRGQRAEPRLMTLEDVRLVIESRDMRNITWFVDPSFEVAHGGVHNFVSGVFADLANSASDPLFFMHHAFIDCLWEEQRQRISSSVDYRSLYPTDEEALGVGVVQPDGNVLRNARDSPHHPAAEMRPFGPLTNIDGVSNEYEEYYSYSPRPTCSPSHRSCDSEALFCDMRSWQCVVKLQQGAACSRWQNYDPCYKSMCCEGVCRDECHYWTPYRTVGATNFRRSPERDSSSYVRPQPPTHPPEYFLWHQHLERLAFG